jgi:hypothetical protein
LFGGIGQESHNLIRVHALRIDRAKGASFQILKVKADCVSRVHGRSYKDLTFETIFTISRQQRSQVTCTK